MAKKRFDYLLESENQADALIEISSTPDVKETGNKTVTEILAEIGKLPGVIGYISRNETGATIDINAPDKIIDYAMLSTELISCIEVVEQQFEAGSVECVLAKGKYAKVLCLANDIYKISVFMNNSADNEVIRQKLKHTLVRNFVK
jgi:hypothetical protein